MQNRLLGWTIILFSVAPLYASAMLQVFPTHIFLNNRTKVANISVRHTGPKPCRYRITPVFYRMTEEGGLVLATDTVKDEERSAMKLIRFSPRQTTLNPNLEQVVRIIYAGPQSLPEGEYRMHLHFEPLDDENAPPTNGQGQISTQLTARVAVAVPVVYRSGTPSYEVKLSNLKFIRAEPNKPAFSLELAKTGKAFPFGDFYAFYQPKKTQKDETNKIPVGLVRGVSSYVEKRIVKYPLTVPSGMMLASGGKLSVEFRLPESEGGKMVQVAETVIP